jgi:hypothetical protein
MISEARRFGGAEPGSPAGAQREWKIEDRLVRSVVREMSISENYEGEITPHPLKHFEIFERLRENSVQRFSAQCNIVIVRTPD